MAKSKKSSPSKHASAAAYQREQSKAFGKGYLAKARVKKAKKAKKV